VEETEEVQNNFPLSWLCVRQATSDVIELAFNAHPPAMHEEGRDGRGDPPLHFACSNKAPLEVVQFLVERNPATLEMANDMGWLPLHYACSNKASLEVVQFLVERNPASLGMADTDGRLPLHFACSNKASVEGVQLLVERNPAALEMANDMGWLPLHYAWSNKAPLEVVQFLVERRNDRQLWTVVLIHGVP
jgi:ankyrin repeat protein